MVNLESTLLAPHQPAYVLAVGPNYDHGNDYRGYERDAPNTVEHAKYGQARRSSHRPQLYVARRDGEDKKDREHAKAKGPVEAKSGSKPNRDSFAAVES